MTQSSTQPKTPKHAGHTTVWLPTHLCARIDRLLAARQAAAGSGLRPNRQAFITAALARYLDGLPETETEAQPQP